MNTQLPLMFRWFVGHGVKKITPWKFINLSDTDYVDALRREYRLEVGGERDLFPFAKRQDMDTIAGFVVENGEITEPVITVHLTWIGKKERPGYPGEGTDPTFRDWLSNVLLPDAEEWMSEEDLEDIVDEAS